MITEFKALSLELRRCDVTSPSFGVTCRDNIDRFKFLLGGGVIIPLGVTTRFKPSFERFTCEVGFLKLFPSLDEGCESFEVKLIAPLEPNCNLLFILIGGVNRCPSGVKTLFMDRFDPFRTPDLLSFVLFVLQNLP